MPCLASNKKVFTIPGAAVYEKFFSNSADPRYAEIGQNRFIIPSSWDQFTQFLQQVFSKDDLVWLSNTIMAEQKEFGNWYKSDEPIT